MKTFQKITLAAAISAAPFMSQAMEALDDSVLGNTTGQAGVTIEINIDDAISIGEILYTDTAHVAQIDGTTLVNDASGNAPGDAGYVDTYNQVDVSRDGGSVSLQNIRISNVNKLTQTIDVTENGDLAIGMSEVNGIKIALGGNTVDENAVVTNHSAVALQAAGGTNETELVNNLDVTLNVGAHTTYIRNLQGRSAADMDALKIPTAAQGGSVAIQSVAKLQITDMNVGAFGYTAAQSTVQGAKVNGALTATSAGFTDIVGGATAAQQAAGANSVGLAKAEYLIGKYNESAATPVSTSVSVGTALTVDQQDAVNSVIANGSAVQISGVEFYGKDASGAKTFATIDQTIWAKGGPSSIDGGVYINIGEINGTLEVGAITIGGSSIGSIAVSDINLAGMTQRIYGH